MKDAVAFVVLLLAVAGCTAPGEARAECLADGQTPGCPDPTGEHSDTTGAIEGSVVDDSISPIGGASVGIKETGANTTTSAAGLFAFSNLDPGAYTMFVSALGYESTSTSVVVEAGVASRAQVVLQALAVVEPYTEMTTFAGLIECGFGTSAVVGNCIPLQFLFDQIGQNPTSTRTVGKYPIRDPPTVAGGVFEMSWQPSSAGSSQVLGLYVDADGAGPVGGTNYAQKEDKSPVRIEVGKDPYKPLTATANKVQTRTFLPGTTPPSYVVNQRFTVFGTACYVLMCEESYSAVKEG